MDHMKMTTTNRTAPARRGRALLRVIRAVGAISAMIAGGVSAINCAHAQTYPTRPIVFYAPSAAGSAADVQARILATILSGELKQSINVVDMAGGLGAVSQTQLQARPADGYTLLFDLASELGYNIARKMIPFKLKDFVGVAGVGGDAVSLVARTDDSRFASVPQFVAFARAHPNTLNIGGFGSTGQFLQAYTELTHAASINARYIPYDGGSQLVVALLGGQIDAAVTAPSNVVTNDRLRILAIASENTFTPLPSVPTFVKSGYHVIDPILRGFYVRVGTPGPVVERLGQAVMNALKDPRWEKFAKQEVIETKFMGPAAWHAYTATELGDWQRAAAQGSK
jgi:tripartite-type tricarboxylate transporter receptor subunit TctC